MTEQPAVTYGGAETEEFEPGTPAAPAEDPPPVQLAQVLALGLGFVNRAGDLWDALLKVSDTNTAKPALEVVTDVALRAALPLVTD